MCQISEIYLTHDIKLSMTTVWWQVYTSWAVIVSAPLPPTQVHCCSSSMLFFNAKNLLDSSQSRLTVCFFLLVCTCAHQVRTKTVPQCVEYYYLSKKLHDKQEKEKEQERQECELEQQTRVSWALCGFSASLVWLFPLFPLPVCCSCWFFHRDYAWSSHALRAVLSYSAMPQR